MIIIKNQQQIEGIRKSCHLAAQTLNFIKPFVIPGVSTEELDNKIEEYIRDNGAIPAPKGYKNYPKATCISVNEVICHGIPNAYRLKEGDILNIDVTTILDGYFGDTSTMFAVGEISEEAKYLLAVAKECLEIGIAQARDGNRIGNIGYFINKFATAKHCSVVHQFAGHGCGLAFHEDPLVPFVANKDAGPRLKSGMIITVEPMLNLGKADAVIDENDKWTARTIDGKLSAQYEHMILVVDRKRSEILTLLPTS